MTLTDLAQRVRSHYRAELTPGARKYCEWLASIGSATDEVWLAQGARLTGRDLATELLKLLPAPKDEAQRWVINALKELAL